MNAVQGIREAIAELEGQRVVLGNKIAALQGALAVLEGGAVAPAAATPVRRGPGRPRKNPPAPSPFTMAGPTPVATKKPEKKKRNLSPEGRRAIIEATKRRWAQHHAAKAGG